MVILRAKEMILQLGACVTVVLSGVIRCAALTDRETRFLS